MPDDHDDASEGAAEPDSHGRSGDGADDEVAPLGAMDDLDRDLDIDIAAIEEEEARAARRLSAIEAGRRKGGVAGAAMAGAMLALSEIYEGPKKDEIVAVAESPDEPGDIDKDGIEVTVGEVDVWAPPPSPNGDASSDDHAV